MDFGLLPMRIDGQMLKNSIVREAPRVNVNEIVLNSAVGEPHLGQDDQMIRTSSGRDLIDVQGDERELAVASGDARPLVAGQGVEEELSVAQADENVEPYIGMEFDSEADARDFYIEYGTQMGFNIRVSSLSRSRRDRSIIARALVCNKEGFRSPDKRRKGIKPHAPTRVGCKAMIGLKKLSTGKWIITKFVKDHSHALNPGKDRKPSVDERIRELSQQLLLERRQSAAYRRQLELVFKHIDEFMQDMSKKIQYIVDNVKEAESNEKERRHHDNPDII